MARAKMPTTRLPFLRMLVETLRRPVSLQRAVWTIALLLVAGLGFLSLSRVRHQAWLIVSDTLPGLSDAGMANSNAADDFNLILRALMATTSEERTRLRAEADRNQADAARSLVSYQNSIFDNEDRANFNHMQEFRKQYLEIRAQVCGLLDQGKDKEALARYKQSLLPAYTRYMAAGAVLLDYNTRQGGVRGKGIMRNCNLSQFAVAGFTIALFVLGFVVGVFRYDPFQHQPQTGSTENTQIPKGETSDART
jgi:hypothetical protein